VLVRGAAKRYGSGLLSSLATCLALIRLAAELLAQPLPHRLGVLAGINVRLGRGFFHHLVADLHLAHNANVAELLTSRLRVS
jgi:hypothetical protein